MSRAPLDTPKYLRPFGTVAEVAVALHGCDTDAQPLQSFERLFGLHPEIAETPVYWNPRLKITLGRAHSIVLRDYADQRYRQPLRVELHTALDADTDAAHAELLDTFGHEVAHFVFNDHSARWSFQARALGSNGQRTYSPERGRAIGIGPDLRSQVIVARCRKCGVEVLRSPQGAHRSRAKYAQRKYAHRGCWGILDVVD